MKKIEDYLHLYLGSEVIHTDDQFQQKSIVLTHFIASRWNENMKLVLRPLSDMTEEELFYVIQGKTSFRVIEYSTEIDNDRKYFLYRLDYNGRRSKQMREFYNGHRTFSPECMRYLLSKGFDLFGLIDSGLAIDKTKISHLEGEGE